VLRLAILIAAAVTTQAAAFDLQGHRGARGLAPENTLPAFARALAIGVTTLELDAGLTEDGVVVVAHDRRLNPDIARGTDGRWLVGRTRTIRS
jgi:glycerophosphoryl diester phosphodiesterase